MTNLYKKGRSIIANYQITLWLVSRKCLKKKIVNLNKNKLLSLKMNVLKIIPPR